MKARLRNYAQLMRLDRPVGIWLLLWPTLWALWLAARGLPPLWLLGVFVAGTVLMRSAGCVINDFADRKFDPHVERTRERPLAAGRVKPVEALVLFVVLCLLALLCALPLNALALWLAVPAVVLAASYPFAKRFHALPQAHLGLAFSWGIPMAYAAVRGSVPWLEAGMLMAANVCWVIAYDTLYAMADREDDLKIGVKSSAILFGRHDLLIVGMLHAVCLALLAWLGRETTQSWPYFAGLGLAGLFAVQEQVMARHRDRARCFAAFLHNVALGAAIFAGLSWSGVLQSLRQPHADEAQGLVTLGGDDMNPGGCVAADPLARYGTGLGYCVHYDLPYTPPDWPKPLLADVVTPQGHGPFPAVILVHGGSWRAGSRKAMEGLAERLARRGYVAITVGYRLAPEFRFPAQLRDLQEAVRWTRHNAHALEVERNRIGVWGFSAGAHLALMLGMVGPRDALSFAGARVQAVVGGGTPTDLAKFDDDDEPTLLGVTYAQDPKAYERASPIHYADRGDPPVFLYHGDEDSEVPLDQAEAMVQALDRAGAKAELHIVRGGGHDQAPQEAFDAAVAFLDRTLRPH